MFSFFFDPEFWHLFRESAQLVFFENALWPSIGAIWVIVCDFISWVFSLKDFWSAIGTIATVIAAFGSAFAAYMSWSAQERTLHHTFRPDIIPTDWTRPGIEDGKPEKMYFNRICNHGRDTAHLIKINASYTTKSGGKAHAMGDLWSMNLCANYEICTTGCILIYWDNVPDQGLGNKLLPLEVTAWFRDALDICHTTVFSIVVFQDPKSPFQGGPCIAPGIYMVHRVMTSIAAKKSVNPSPTGSAIQRIKSWIPKYLVARAI